MGFMYDGRCITIDDSLQEPLILSAISVRVADHCHSTQCPKSNLFQYINIPR